MCVRITVNEICIRHEVDCFKSVNQGHLHTSTVQVHEVWSERNACVCEGDSLCKYVYMTCTLASPSFLVPHSFLSFISWSFSCCAVSMRSTRAW